MNATSTSVRVRVAHTVGYEAFAVLLLAPVMAWVMDKPIATAGAVTVTLSCMAMAWNVVYNVMVDRYAGADRSQWKFGAFALHGIGFEVGIIVLCLPVVAWMLSISLLQAFVMEIGFFVLILPYTMIYNWAFYKVKARLEQRGRLATKPHVDM